MVENIKKDGFIPEKPLLLTVSCFLSIFINSLLIIVCFISLFSISFLKDFSPLEIKPENEIIIQSGIGILCLLFITSLFSSIKISQLKLSGYVFFMAINIFLFTVLLITINSRYAEEFHYWLTGFLFYLLVVFSLFLKRYN